jgi:hypothetical protein
MEDIQQAAALMGNAAAVMAKREALLSDISTWAEANPYKVYGDYRDELGPELAGTLLESREKFDEEFWEIERNAADYAEWGDHHKELCEEFEERIREAYPDEFGDDDSEVEWDALPYEVQTAFEESSCVDCSDFLDTMLRSTRLHIVAVPVDPDAPEAACEEGGIISPPNFALDAETNEARQAYLAEKFGIDGWAAESCYNHECLKVMGRLDLREVYEKGRPKAVTITPQDNLIFHTSFNGSGCLGDVKATKEVTLAASFVVDDGDRYGIDSVYGFTGEPWSQDITVAEWEPW